MRLRPRSPFVLSIAATASLAGCGSSSPEPESTPPTHTMNPPMPDPEPPPPTPEPTGRENPPVVVTCPPEAPAVGEGCAAGLVCHYGSTDPCDAGWVELRCVDGTFAPAARPTCNPPPPPAATSKP